MNVAYCTLRMSVPGSYVLHALLVRNGTTQPSMHRNATLITKTSSYRPSDSRQSQRSPVIEHTTARNFRILVLTGNLAVDKTRAGMVVFEWYRVHSYECLQAMAEHGRGRRGTH